MNTFSISEALRVGWKRVTENLMFFIALSLLAFAVSFVGEYVTEMGSGMRGPLGLVYPVLYFIASLAIGLAFLHSAINAARGRRASFGTMFPSGSVALNYLGAMLLVALVSFAITFLVLIVAGGFALSQIFNAGEAMGMTPLVAAGLGVLAVLAASIYFSIRLQFFQYAIVGDNAAIIESFKKSWRVTRGEFWHLVSLVLVLVLVNLIGLIALFIGLLVTLPLTAIATAYVYDTLRRGSEPPVPTMPGSDVPPPPPSPAQE